MGSDWLLEGRYWGVTGFWKGAIGERLVTGGALLGRDWLLEGRYWGGTGYWRGAIGEGLFNMISPLTSPAFL